VDTVLTMGIMEDVSFIPQPAEGKKERMLYIVTSVTMRCIF